ncbi:MAG: GyrI-like domain-containing protein [Bacteroidales bacterium]|jgi:AraC family transcriptional regulator
MFLRFEILREKKIICKRMTMSHSDYRPFELWHSFMPARKEIRNTVSDDLYSIALYGGSFDFKTFSPDMEFDKLAGMEVNDFDSVPAGMEPFILPGGLYAVFIHKGTAADAPETFGYIFGTWLPASEYIVDLRPHFEILGEKYKRDDSSSEEEVWIPVKPKP